MAKKTLIERHGPWQKALGFFYLVLMAFAFYGAEGSPVAEKLSRGQRISFLLFGIDAADASKHTDTLMVGVFDPLLNQMAFLSIPRDTRIHLPGFHFNRVNEIYGYHLRREKDPMYSSYQVMQGLQAILSSDKTPFSISYFLQVDYGGFKRIIDILGGVWVTIKQSMNYDDFAGGYHFHKEPGRYLLKGDEALFYVRFRGQTGDKGRIFRQQEFIRLILRKLATPLALWKAPELIEATSDTLRTNFSLWDLMYLAVACRRLRPPDMNFYILPGRPRGPYWEYDKDLAPAFASHVLLGTPLTDKFIQPIQPQAEVVRVNVWNASGQRNLAYELTRYLRRSGYDVVDWGTYAARQVTSRIIDRRGKIGNAQAIASELGVENVHSEPALNALVDVEVVVGEDFHPPVHFEE